MKKISTDTAVPVAWYARPGRTFEKTLNFQNSDGTDFDFTGVTLTFVAYLYGTEKMALTNGDGITITGGQVYFFKNHELYNLHREDYTYELIYETATIKKTWFIGPLVSSNDIRGSIQDTDTITISLEGESVTVTVQGGSNMSAEVIAEKYHEVANEFTDADKTKLRIREFATLAELQAHIQAAGNYYDWGSGFTVYADGANNGNYELRYNLSSTSKVDPDNLKLIEDVPEQVTTAEKEAGTSTEGKLFSPKDVVDMTPITVPQDGQQFDGDGVTTEFTATGTSKNVILAVDVGGNLQVKGVHYTLSGLTVTFITAPVAGSKVTIHLGLNLRGSNVALTTISIPEKNLFDVDNHVATGYTSSSTGAPTNGPDGWERTGYISINDSKLYTISGWNTRQNNRVTWFSGNTSADILLFQDGLNPSEGVISLEPPTGAKYLMITLKDSTETTDVYSNLQIEEGLMATDYEPYSSTQYISEINGKPLYIEEESENLTERISENETRVIKNGNLVYIRNRFDETRDIVQKLYLYEPSRNQGFDLLRTYLVSSTTLDVSAELEGGELIHTTSDDTAPMNVDGHGHIGMGHGLPCPIISGPHDKTQADLLSEWTDGTYNYYLIEVRDDNTLIFYGKPYDLGDGNMGTRTTVTSTTLTHVSGATNTSNIDATNNTYEQQYPVEKNHDVKLILDGEEITDDGIYDCEVVEIVSQHEMVDPATLNVDLPFTFNNGTTFVKFTTTYSFQPNGACVIHMVTDWKSPKTLNYWYGLQSVGMNTNAENTKLKYYIPKVGIVSGLDFTTLEDMTSPPAAALYFRTADLLDVNNPVERYIQYLADTADSRKIGFALGFNNQIGVGKNDIRSSIGEFWNIATTKKTYPRIVFDFAGVDDVIEWVGHRIYFDADKPYSSYYYEFGGYVYLYIEFHEIQNKVLIPVPNRIGGSAIETLEITASVTLHTDAYIPQGGVIVSCTTNYGYVVVKAKSR